MTRLPDYTHVTVNGNTHLADPYSRETICGLDKKHKPTVWFGSSWGTGCQDCQTVALARLAEEMAIEVGKLDRFVSGKKMVAA